MWEMFILRRRTTIWMAARSGFCRAPRPPPKYLNAQPLISTNIYNYSTSPLPQIPSYRHNSPCLIYGNAQSTFTMARKFFVGGNFKMNGTSQSISDIITNLNNAKLDANTEVVISPPAIYLLLARSQADSKIGVAAQNVFDKPNGAFTGELSVDQLKDSKITWTLTGHSERRVILKEDDDFVARKTKAAVEGGLNVIVCIGESLEEREANKTVDVVTRQLQAIADKVTEQQWSNIVIAYEPIWAIGTGKVATTEQAQEVHASIREWLCKTVSPAVSEATRVIYGGSVNEKNCAELAKQKDVDGFLVGGASLKPAFVDIINSRL
ncbi:triosephosphate isomerase [Trichophyton rubrum D6]|uniref:Triosephosphate isomerase n=4 Tax=Trichophyton TaxID=5550 RepID=F2T109_TRIRC|nr:triosephosphate isomerase [Trichophyton rubrum CBS 118892]EZF27935.1 triosephosphate isomerase [Trichophyton rubrum MR850]EZF46941.1 triosephosphate isomerase [Trichophyton rubrum CBS 100081]EZF57566.1 triosephosphate isomerase [Trichophyton rubrum CBS 288.86]EZF68219.1 triosephosphate isomerase [Trichophyton rubrum CBS 289.86]EZF89504.1 triosephosphate isomerase [Trichophyton rubrum MR1448]EZG00319.1 triosephosphate isomerase [Trichophyton rubrum MR1459]EZG11219.1 triosephosphate isomera